MNVLHVKIAPLAACVMNKPNPRAEARRFSGESWSNGLVVGVALYLYIYILIYYIIFIYLDLYIYMLCIYIYVMYIYIYTFVGLCVINSFCLS